jgi:hypothetical protein
MQRIGSPTALRRYARHVECLHTFARERCPLTQLIRVPNEVTIVVE